MLSTLSAEQLAGGSGDDLAFATASLIAIACAAWLAITTLAFLVALAHGDCEAAARAARLAPPIARRILETALATAFALAPAAAHAAAPPAPLTLHVGTGGRLTTVPAPRPHEEEPGGEVPVVRAPPTSTTAPTPTTTVPAPTTAPLPRPPGAHTYVVPRATTCGASPSASSPARTAARPKPTLRGTGSASSPRIAPRCARAIRASSSPARS